MADYASKANTAAQSANVGAERANAVANQSTASAVMPVMQAKEGDSEANELHLMQAASVAAMGSANRSGLADNRAQAIAQHRLFDTAANSAQAKRLQAVTDIAQNSKRTTQLQAMTAMMNSSPRQSRYGAVQRLADEDARQAKPEGGTVQREAVAASPRPNNTGLPDNLKSGIESLSGMSMDHVKVHYNSSQPAQLNAHAYAQGSEIHVAPGQEQHVPHEAWHVVQQAQGRVRPTMQMKAGVPVNDDAGLEAEADVMGQKALQAMADARDLRTEPVPQMGPMQLSRLGGVGMLELTSQRTQRKSGIQIQLRIGECLVGTSSDSPLQRMVTQIIPGEAENIKSINVVGRPEKLFSNSMGDHTTAFATHIAGIRLKLEGQTFQNAILELNSIYQQAKALPGYGLKDNLSRAFGFGRTAGQGLRLANAEKELALLIASANENTDITAKALLLQEAISAYLEFRELIPLSGVNVMSVAPALAGKGKGESGHVATLMAHEKGTVQDQETLKSAVEGTFDMHAAVLVVTSVDEQQLASLAPGVPATMSINERILYLVRQHLQSLHNNFPKSVENSGVDEKSLGDLIFDGSKGQLQLLCLQIDQRIVLRKMDLESRNESISAGINKTKYDKRARDEVAAELAELEKHKELISGALAKSTGFEIEAKPLVNLDQKADIKEVVGKEEEENEELEEEVARSSIATQVRLTGDVYNGYFIKSLELAGRPPSPISGSMGAHTSAWLLHEARIKGALSGKTIESAVVTMNALIDEAIGLHDTLAKANPPRELNQDSLAQSAKQKLLDRQKRLSDLHGKDRTPTRLAFELQQYINELLTYTNYIPGVTRDAGNTDGRGEAKWKRILTDIENRLVSSVTTRRSRTKSGAGRSVNISHRLTENEYKQVESAIRGLLDVTDLENKDVYMLAHLELLKKVFPKTVVAYNLHNNPFF